ncbi:hypothetical protein OG285_13590 [Streptomyces sp. NBC_01471]|uniref:hypothetical protein n=1 Tax=Streptomyces sp. NBC_01471 TaxID=2903879 RepID=UPI0032535B69
MHSPRQPLRRLVVPLVVTAALNPTSAYALGEPGHEGKPSGDTGNHSVNASVSDSQIKIIHVSGGGGGKKGNLAPIDANWKPPACWYEPLFTPEQLKQAVKKNQVSDVGIHEFWSNGVFVDHYEKGISDKNFDGAWSTAPGYKNYNIGQKGYFWRSVAPDVHDEDSWDCGRIMFWQDANTVPKIPHAPTPKMLADYAYNQVKVPDTEVELKPATKSTVNLPTWVWLDRASFQEVKVRAELPHTGLWAETTAKPVSLHLDPGTEDAETYPSSGDCSFKADGSIGTPYAKGDATKTPPCGINYLRATNGEPFQLKASITWKITWEGSDHDGVHHDLPNGTFETTQDMNVQEIQAINR